MWIQTNKPYQICEEEKNCIKMFLVPTEKGVSTAVSHHAPTKSLLFLRVFIKHGTFLHLTVYVPVRSWYYLYWTPSHDKSAGH